MPDAVHISLAGLCRGKGGPGAYGLSISTPLGDTLFTRGHYFAATTAPLSTYTALVEGLEEAARLGARRVIVYSDSDLVVAQMRGRVSVREEALKDLHHKAWMLAARLHFQIIHVSADRNRGAITLAEAAMAASAPPPCPAPRAQPERPPPPAPAPPWDPLSRKMGIQQSAGGVVYKHEGGLVCVCLIAKGKVWALPKGRLNEGETPEETASREILEETGHVATIQDKLHDIDYWFYWKENNTLYHKTVTFFLMQLVEENRSTPDGEADAVQWFPILESYQRLTYPNEKDVLRKAMVWLKEQAASEAG